MKLLEFSPIKTISFMYSTILRPVSVSHLDNATIYMMSEKCYSYSQLISLLA
jgi:hypothetical protein